MNRPEPRQEQSMNTLPEETLDPAEWDEFRRFAHRALDDSIDYLAGLRDEPVWRPIPEAVRQGLTTPLPRQGAGADAAYREFRELILPYAAGNAHPRFWGWVKGNGTPMGVVSEMLMATMNVNATGFEQSSTYVELQVIEWFKELMGYPTRASGLLVSGGSVSNLVGMNVARSAKAPFAVRREGLSGHARLMYYTSTETHNSAQKAVELMGLGDVRTKSHPKMCLIAAPRQGGSIATRSFIPHVCHDAIGVLAAVTVGTACVLEGSVAQGIAVVPAGAVKTLSVEHPSGEFSVELELDPARSQTVKRAALVRTARLIMRGEVMVPYAVWPTPRRAKSTP